MPRERTLVAYHNAHYMALVRQTLARRQPILVKLPNQAAAATMRGELYAWRRVAEKNPVAAEKLGVDLELLRQVAFRIKPEGLECLPTSFLPGPGAIEAALGQAVEAALAPEGQALEELKKKLGLGAPQDGPPLPYDLGDK
jgi:hypothetical protein